MAQAAGKNVSKARRPRWLRWSLGIAIVVLVTLLLLECGFRAYLFSSNRFDDTDTFDLYAVGGSSMVGMPYSSFHRQLSDEERIGKLSFPNLVGKMFDWRIGDRPLSVHLLAREGESTYPQLYRLRQAVRYRNPDRPGAVLIYSGHNDNTAVTGPDVYGGHNDDSQREVDDDGGWALERFLFSHLLGISEIFYRVRRALGITPEYSQRAYEIRLRRLIEESLNASLLPVLSTVVGNVSDIEPTLEGGTLIPADALGPGEELQGKGEFEAAIRAFEKTRERWRERDSTGIWANLIYRMAECHRAVGRVEQARELYWQALDKDPRQNFGRATRAQNALIRKLAVEYDVPLVDSVARFEEASPDGLIGYSLFSDGHHPNVEGYWLLGEGFAEALSAALGEPIRGRYRDGAEWWASLLPEFTNPIPHRIQSSGWLLASSAMHPWPQKTLQRIAVIARELIAHDPDEVMGWLFLAVASTSSESQMLMDEAFVEQLAQWGVIYASHQSLRFSDREFDAFVSRLRLEGSPPKILGELTRTWELRGR